MERALARLLLRTHAIRGSRIALRQRGSSRTLPQLRHCVAAFSSDIFPRNGLRVLFAAKTRPAWLGWNRGYADVKGAPNEIVVPFMGDSVPDGNLASVLKNVGDSVVVDEIVAQIETDKVTIDVRSSVAGRIEQILARQGDTVTPGTKVAIVAIGEPRAASPPGPTAFTTPSPRAPAAASPAVTVAPPPPKPGPVKVDAAAAASPKADDLSSPKRAAIPQLQGGERRVPMTRLRKRVATRLKDSQNTFALLTTFNELDMGNLMELRSQHKDTFLEKHGVKLGFMSGFVKGLVVPVLRGVDGMNFAQIEKMINMLGKKANDGSITIDDMAGGTFTISNGGVYGSLISTPIINPPQSAILGMHSIVKRPMVVGKDIIARPMMYVALTYDHRLIDGREAVLFLRAVKDNVEDPRRLLLDI
nr:dihydrolipoyllysine-residue succinyltransferase component of 2-oxoglutarate dehydrogenase complex 2, mitochondrial-like isoform X2 [Physcomitrium patens]|eukprot:XP_024379955.1 dihydrolipoyllysine-residue succinyltransferase component of 2-oxoglutarate dehydrogenase complex 2, mitochondrial-like isoform X2 [Physcomitrella patens]